MSITNAAPYVDTGAPHEDGGDGGYGAEQAADGVVRPHAR